MILKFAQKTAEIILDFFQGKNSESYRQRKGGKWYKVYRGNQTFHNHGLYYWTQNPKVGHFDLIVETIEY